MTSDKKTLLEATAASANRKFMSVGGDGDTPVDLVADCNVDSNRPCLGNGQTVLMRTPTQTELVECWSETIIRTGIPPTVVDNPLSRKVLVITSRMDRTEVCMGKETALGKKDTTLHITIHSRAKLFRRQTRDYMKRRWKSYYSKPSRFWTKQSVRRCTTCS